MTLPDELRILAAEIRLRHLEGQLGQPWALTEGADRIDDLEVDNAASALLIADQAYRIGQLEAESTQLRDRMNALADVLTQHDLAHLLKPCGIHGWTPTDGWLMVEAEDGAA